MDYLELIRASDGTLSRWSWLPLQPLAPTNPHWARVVVYGPFSLCLTHKEGFFPSCGDNNRLMMIMLMMMTGGKHIRKPQSVLGVNVDNSVTKRLTFYYDYEGNSFFKHHTGVIN
jgi:hypothetical protein